MTIYLIILFIVVISAAISENALSVFGSRLFLSIGLLTMLVAAGLRSRTVGTDTGSYIVYYSQCKSFSDVLKIGGQTYEYGYSILNWIVHFISNQYIALFFIIALIVISCYHWAIVTYSIDIVISYYIFITMGFYAFFFNGARQGISSAICAVALGSLIKKKTIRYCTLISLAALFHKSALILIPIYFLLQKSGSIKTHLIYIFLGIIGALYLQEGTDYISQLDHRYHYYGTSGTGGGYLMGAFTCILVVLFYFCKSFVHIHRENYLLFMNMFIFGAIISVISIIFRLNPSGILRLTLYFNMSAIFLWPIIFKNIKNRRGRYLFGYSFFVGYLIFFVLTTQKFSNLTPYHFNPVLYLFD